MNTDANRQRALNGHATCLHPLVFCVVYGMVAVRRITRFSTQFFS